MMFEVELFNKNILVLEKDSDVGKIDFVISADLVLIKTDKDNTYKVVKDRTGKLMKLKRNKNE